jgi:curved DNA-binding protein CbpA
MNQVMRETKQQSFYEVLDVSMSAKPEMIRTAYIRAKNTYARDSLAVYTLFEPDESRRILEQIEEAYNVLSDPDRRRKYDELHGFMSFDTESARRAPEPDTFDTIPSQKSSSILADEGNLEEDRFSNPHLLKNYEMDGPQSAPSPMSAIDRLQATSQPSAMSNSGTTLSPANFNSVRPYKIQRQHEANPEMEDKIKRAENITGVFLKEIREYKKASVEEVMDITKISKNYILALESDDVSKLPAAVYVRGFVAQYAKALGLESDRFANAYMIFYKSKRT